MHQTKIIATCTLLTSSMLGHAYATSNFVFPFTTSDFVFPVSNDEPSDPGEFVQNRTNPIGNGWHGGGVGASSVAPYIGHLGQDYFFDEGITEGRRVYSIADGTVVAVMNSEKKYGWCDAPNDDGTDNHGWGRVILIRHYAPSGFYFNTDGSIVSQYYDQKDDRCPQNSSCAIQTNSRPTVIYSLYGHLSATDFEVTIGDEVKAGQPIARIGDRTEQPWSSPHLHLEIKSEEGLVEGVWSSKSPGAHSSPQACNAIGIGSGYSYIDGYAPERYDPNTFIKQRRQMTFEDDNQEGLDKKPIRSEIPGLSFSTTNGFDWVFGNIEQGVYNAKTAPDASGPFAIFGSGFAWLGPNQGAGRIDFNASIAQNLSLSYSSTSQLFLEAYDLNGNLIDQDSGLGNTGTGTLGKLEVDAVNISHVIVHDTGNYWLIDNLSVSDVLADARIVVPFNASSIYEQAESINQNEIRIFNFFNDAVRSLIAVLEWPGSALSVTVFDPSGDMVAEAESDEPPIILDIPNASIGQWTVEIRGVDVPHFNYPFGLIVYGRDSAFDGAALMIEQAAAIIADLSLSDIKSFGNKNALLNYLAAATKAVARPDNKKAIERIEFSLKRTDGCSERGEPDPRGEGRDWISNCDAQVAIYNNLKQAIAALE